MSRPDSLRVALPKLRRTLRHFAPHLRPQRRLLAGGLVALLLEVVLRLLEPWPLAFVIDRLLAAAPAGTGAAPGDLVARLPASTLLAGAALAAVAVVGLRALAAYTSTVAFALAGNRVLTAVRADTFRHLQRLGMGFHDRARRGDLLTRVTGDVGRLQDVAVTAALPLVGHVITLVAMVAVMVWLDWRLAAVALVPFPLFALSMVRLTGRIRAVSRKQRKVEGALATTAAEALGAMQVVKAYSLEPVLEETFAGQNASSLRDGVKGKRLAAGLERRTDVLVAVGTGLVLFYGARQVLAGVLSAGDLIVFLSYLKNAFKPLRDMAKYSGRVAKAAASGERIVEVLDTEPDVVDAPAARPAPPLRGEVTFERVSFGYDSAHPVLREVDLHVRAGQRVALVGRSGAGKSTLAGLVLRLYDPDTGAVRVDGTDVRSFTLESLRRQVAVVLQDSVLFATTIRENIAYGAPGASDEQVEAAARLANAHGFITALPDGYDTVVGERGATLSGGQRQRIAIARAAVRDAPIVILDEPTSSLDEGNEREVQAALDALTHGRTVFVISHDLTSVRSADVIVVLEDGGVAEHGRHAQLVRRRGPYAELHRLASGRDGLRARMGDRAAAS